MERHSVEAVIEALNAADVRYLITGGLAVVAHGYVRFTADLDLIVQLDDENVRPALEALEALGYAPRAPVSIEQFADADMRRQWIEQKGLTVFSLFSPEHPATEIDLFVEEPFDFERAYKAALRQEVAAGIDATFVSYEDLLELKRKAGRPQDLHDIERLEELRRNPANGGDGR